jgi:C-terminal processing protease CtpA/Prc
VDLEAYHSGSFVVGDFMIVRQASAKFQFVDQRVYESIGIVPDIVVPYLSDAYEKGIDIQLETALQLLE